MKILLKFLIFFLVLVLIFGVSDSLLKSITGGTSLVDFFGDLLNVPSNGEDGGSDSSSNDETTSLPAKETEAPQETDKPLCKKHTYSNVGIFDIVSATCESKGSFKNTCTECGYVKTETQAALGHSYGEYSYYSEAQHVKVCERSGCGQKKYADHSYDGFVCTGCSHVLPIPDDCTHSYGSVTGTGEYSSIDETFHEEYCTMTCEMCGHVEYLWDGAIEHSFEYVAVDDVHIGTCQYCGYVACDQAHYFTNGICDKCGVEEPETPSICFHDNAFRNGDSLGCLHWGYNYCPDCGYEWDHVEIYHHNDYDGDTCCDNCGVLC